ncbi:hypothetical protein L7F22_046800 [Adiantum nelumboides]|nr:hypothetical protein [Adiantum nelumboides]
MPVDRYFDLLEQEYVDDTMLFCQYALDTLERLQTALSIFCCARGSLIYWHKSSGFVVGLDDVCRWGEQKGFTWLAPGLQDQIGARRAAREERSAGAFPAPEFGCLHQQPASHLGNALGSWRRVFDCVYSGIAELRRADLLLAVLVPVVSSSLSTLLGARVSRFNLRRTNLWPCLDPDSHDSFGSAPVKSRNLFGWTHELLVKSSQNRSFTCHALPNGSEDSDSGARLQFKESLFEPEGIATNSAHAGASSNAGTQSSLKNRGRSGIVSFFSLGPKEEQQVLKKTEQLAQTSNEAWISVLWILGPAVLVSSVVLPPFFLRKAFELLLEDSLVTDFLILFFTETLFYAGVFVFLLVAHQVQKATGVWTWNSGSRASLGYKVSSYATMSLAVLLPLGAFAIVWPWTGPAAAAALLPYIAGLAVQYGFEHIVQERKWSVWPLIPIIFQVYRLHQLNRATQLVAGLLYSLRGAEATAETLAVNGSLQTLVMVLQLLGMLCLWALTAYLTHVFSSESQDWQSSAVS